MLVFLKLSRLLILKLPRPKNKFGVKATREYYKEIRNKCEDFVLHNVDITSVEKILNNLGVAKASRIDQIFARFLKDGAPVIAIHLANIINLSIQLDTFPSQCKIAKIKPLFRKGIKTEAKNYKPISLLPLISKVIERSTHDQTEYYLQRNELLYSYQSSFRANHSTDTCLPQLTDMILNCAENGKHTGMILIDLQKAFDTLDHKILLDKMKCIGFSDKTIKWFHSFLTNRAIFVSLDTVFSKAGTINCRVPQGSILGPLLFLLYINDILQALPNTHRYLYADDTSIFCKHKDVTKIENVLNKEFADVCDWFVDNKLSIHIGEDKTKCILFSRDKNLPELNITYNNDRIKQYRMVECLGCCLDANLSGESMTMKSFRKTNTKLFNY